MLLFLQSIFFFKIISMSFNTQHVWKKKLIKTTQICVLNVQWHHQFSQIKLSECTKKDISIHYPVSDNILTSEIFKLFYSKAFGYLWCCIFKNFIRMLNSSELTSFLMIWNCESCMVFSNNKISLHSGCTDFFSN